MRNVIKYMVIFAVVVVLLLTFLVATAKIPKKLIAENVKESEKCFRTNGEIEIIKKIRAIHIYMFMLMLFF